MIQITTNPNKQNRQKLCLCLRCMVERSTCLSRQIYYFLMSMNFFPFNLRFILKSWRKAWFLTQHLLSANTHCIRCPESFGSRPHVFFKKPCKIGIVFKMQGLGNLTDHQVRIGQQTFGFQ